MDITKPAVVSNFFSNFMGGIHDEITELSKIGKTDELDAVVNDIEGLFQLHFEEVLLAFTITGTTKLNDAWDAMSPITKRFILNSLLLAIAKTYGEFNAVTENMSGTLHEMSVMNKDHMLDSIILDSPEHMHKSPLNILAYGIVYLGFKESKELLSN